MNETYLAEHFSRELDRLISQTERTPTSGAPAEFQQALQVAENLAQLDFSTESRQREALRRRLLAQAHRTQEAHMKTLRWRRAMTWSIVGTAALLLLVLTLFYPGGLAVAAQNIYGAIRSIVLGEYSRALQTAPVAGSDSAALPPDVWKIRTEIGNFAGNAPPGVEPTVRSVTTLEEAQAIANFHLMTPTDLPEGYTLREVKLAPIGGTHWVLSFYGGAAHDIILVQMPIGPQLSQKHDELIGIFSGFVTDGALEETDLDGRPAAWANGHSLMWEANGVNYIVGGLGLTLEEAKQIARSLH